MRHWRSTLHFLKDCAKQNLERDGELLPVLLIEGTRPTIVGIRGLGKTAAERQAMMRAIGHQLAPLKPERVSMVCDAYVRRCEDGQIPDGPAADDPAAEECITVVSMDRKGRTRSLVVPYERHPNLDGLEIEFKAEELMADSQPYLLMSFWSGARF